MSDTGGTPLDTIGALAVAEHLVTPNLRHIEVYTTSGLLTVLWRAPFEAEGVVLMGGGAMGGLLGPAEALYPRLADELAGVGIGSLRVGYRSPGELEACVHDMAAAAEMATLTGARAVGVMGHSFGGAVAVRSALAFGGHCSGVVTLATQAPGCEEADGLSPTPLLLIHGDADEILPHMASRMVHMIAGGELRIVPGAGHMFTGHGEDLTADLLDWWTQRFAEHRPGTA